MLFIELTGIGKTRLIHEARRHLMSSLSLSLSPSPSLPLSLSLCLSLPLSLSLSLSLSRSIVWREFQRNPNTEMPYFGKWILVLLFKWISTLEMCSSTPPPVTTKDDKIEDPNWKFKDCDIDIGQWLRFITEWISTLFLLECEWSRTMSLLKSKFEIFQMDCISSMRNFQYLNLPLFIANWRKKRGNRRGHHHCAWCGWV